MKLNSKIITSIRIFSFVAPALVFIGIFVQLILPSNQGEYPETLLPLLFSLIIMILNSNSIIALWFNDSEIVKKNKILMISSLLFGTPVLILLWLGYCNTIKMNIQPFNSPHYLRDECFIKWSNIYKSENRYHYSVGYCPTASQDSIIVTEVYRWGSIKSCGIIIDDVYKQIDTSEITFLTENQKKEILSY